MAIDLHTLAHKLRPRELIRTASNALTDFRFGGFCGGCERNPEPGAHATGPTDYRLMPQFFDGRIGADDVLVDVGCGTGRVLNWWLGQGYRNRIYGIEMMEHVALRTAERLAGYSTVKIVCGDAVTHLPEDGTLFFLANPFDDRFMRPLADRLLDIGVHHPLKIIYFAPTFLDVFAADQWVIDMHPIDLPSTGYFEERHRRFAVIGPRRP